MNDRQALTAAQKQHGDDAVICVFPSESKKKLHVIGRGANGMLLRTYGSGWNWQEAIDNAKSKVGA